MYRNNNGSKFDRDYKRGEIGEKLLESILIGPAENITTIEVKTDYWQKDSGNVAIEVECRGKPSGLMISKAIWYAFYLEGRDRIILIKRKELLRFLNNNIKRYEVRMLGDDKAAKNILVPAEDLVSLYLETYVEKTNDIDKEIEEFRRRKEKLVI